MRPAHQAREVILPQRIILSDQPPFNEARASSAGSKGGAMAEGGGAAHPSMRPAHQAREVKRHSAE